MKTNKEIRSEKNDNDFYNIFLTKISSTWYFAMHTRKLRGKKIDDITQDLNLFTNIMIYSDILNFESNLLDLSQRSTKKRSNESISCAPSNLK